MLDHTTGATRSWTTEVEPGDVVLYAYPVADPESGAKPKYRPCLVVEAEDNATGKRLVLAYGTSVPPKGKRGYDISVRGASDLLVAGLVKPTRFAADRLVSVSVDNPHFALRDRETPIIGRLSSASRERMNRVRARLHAEHDIATERRLERAIRRSFVVETRTRKKLLSHA